MKKGQIGNVIVYISIVIVAAFVLYFGFTQITKFISLSKEGELISFVKALESSLEKNRASPVNREGSVKEESLLLPEDIQGVCFVDETRGFNTLVSQELNERIRLYEGYNVYFMPSTIMPRRVDYLELSEGNNPLCIKSIDGKLKLKLTSRRGRTQLDGAELNKTDVGCVLASGASDPINKVDIVFLGDGYDRKEEFVSDVNGYINNVFFNIEPLKSNRDKFTFYLIDTFEDIDCSFRDWIECDDVKVKKLASNCPHDYIIVLAARSKIADIINPVRSSAFANVQKINTADNQNVAVHEFGHIFAGLADEYVDNKYYSKFDFREEDYPNCDVVGCEEWKEVTAAGCFRGCSLSTYYRPTQSSIMRQLKDKEFGPVSEKVIKDKLDVYGGAR